MMTIIAKYHNIKSHEGICSLMISTVKYLLTRFYLQTTMMASILLPSKLVPLDQNSIIIDFELNDTLQ